MDKLEQVTAKLVDYHSVVRETISTSCYGALLAKGFVVDERIVDEKGNRNKFRNQILQNISSHRTTKKTTSTEAFIHRTSC